MLNRQLETLPHFSLRVAPFFNLNQCVVIGQSRLYRWTRSPETCYSEWSVW